MSYFVSPFLWGLTIFASWIGWGRLVDRWVRPGTTPDLDLGICAGWGMVVMLGFGGILNATATCGPVVVVVLTAFGVATLLHEAWPILRSRRGSILERAWQEKGFIPIVLVVLFIYTASVHWTSFWNINDDYPAYLLYPVKMLQVGAADDPFSLRRLSTLGGYSFLQATTAVVAWPDNAFQLDIGLGGLLNCLLVGSFLLKQGESRFMASIAGLVCLMAPIERINTMCTALGVGGFLLLCRTLHLRSRSDGIVQFRLLWVVGAIAAALGTLRPNYLPIAGLAVLLYEIFRWPKTGRSGLPVIRDLFVMGVVSLLFLMPWSLALHRAGGSYFYPVMKGNDHGVVNLYSAGLTPREFAWFIFGFLAQPEVLLVVILGLFAVRRFRVEALSIWIAALIGAMLVIGRFTLADYPNLTRYTEPPLVAGALAALLSTAMSPMKSWIRPAGRNTLIGVAWLLVLRDCMQPYCFAPTMASVKSGVFHHQPRIPEGVKQEYADVQQMIPPGRRILSFAQYPYEYDFRRNPIFSADLAGLVSPAPGMPVRQGPEALEKYLKDQSIDYLITETFDQEATTNVFSRTFWQGRLNKNALMDTRLPVDHRMAPCMIDVMNNVDAISLTAPEVTGAHGLRVIRLR